MFYFGSYRTMLSKQRSILKPTTDVVPSLTAAACNPDDIHQWSALSAKTAADLPSLWRFEKFMTQEFLPKSAAKKLPDGSLVSPPLEDLAPFLPDEEMDKVMLVKRVK